MDEDRALYLAMIVTGSPPLAIGLAHGTDLGVGATLAGFILVLGALGLVQSFRRTRELLPRAHWRKRHR